MSTASAAPSSRSGGVSGAAIKAFIQGALQSVGLPEADAQEVAILMMEADLTGADAHGIFRLPQYVQRIQAGGIGRAGAAILLEHGRMLIDGNLGLQVQMQGVQVFRVVLLRAAANLPKARLDQYARVAPDLGFEIGNVFEQIETINPQ